MSKPVKRVDLSRLSPEQKAALSQFVRDARAAAPHVEELKQNVQTIFAHWLRSPQWTLNEGEPPEGELPSQSWDIGAPQVTIDGRPMKP